MTVRLIGINSLKALRICFRTTNIFVDFYELVRNDAAGQITWEGKVMAKSEMPRPTEAELAILRVLWERGPSTVREVTEALHEERGTGYTTALKLMQIMTDKGLVRRDDSERTHVYEAVATAETTQRQLVGDLLDRAFGGSARQLVLQALSARRASRDELAEIRRLLDEFEKKAK